MTCKAIVGGRAAGTVLKSAQPINFLGAVDAATGTITDADHDLHGRSMRGAVLAFPNGIGSSVGAYTVYALKSNGAAPAAMICTGPDASVVSGCAIAGIPLVLVGADTFESIVGGQAVTVDADAGTIVPS